MVTVERDSGVLLWDRGFFRRLLPGIKQSRAPTSALVRSKLWTTEPGSHWEPHATLTDISQLCLPHHCGNHGFGGRQTVFFNLASFLFAVTQDQSVSSPF